MMAWWVPWIRSILLIRRTDTNFRLSKRGPGTGFEAEGSFVAAISVGLEGSVEGTGNHCERAIICSQNEVGGHKENAPSMALPCEGSCEVDATAGAVPVVERGLMELQINKVTKHWNS
jgi:hypothetical protein